MREFGSATFLPLFGYETGGSVIEIA